MSGPPEAGGPLPETSPQAGRQEPRWAFGGVDALPFSSIASAGVWRIAADDLVHRRFELARRDRFFIPPPFAVAGNAGLVGDDVRVHFAQAFSQLPPVVALDLFGVQVAV